MKVLYTTLYFIKFHNFEINDFGIRAVLSPSCFRNFYTTLGEWNLTYVRTLCETELVLNLNASRYIITSDEMRAAALETIVKPIINS